MALETNDFAERTPCAHCNGTGYDDGGEVGDDADVGDDEKDEAANDGRDAGTPPDGLGPYPHLTKALRLGRGR